MVALGEGGRMTKDEVLNTIQEWIIKKEASLIAQESKLYYFSSLTAREGDKQWHNMSLKEAADVIKYTLLDTDDKITTGMLVQSFQELGEVYEVAINSPHPAIEGVFNFGSKVALEPVELVSLEFILLLERKSVVGMPIEFVQTIHNAVYEKLNLKPPTRENRNKYLRKHGSIHKYTLRQGDQKPKVNGEEKTVIMKIGTKPRHILVPTERAIGNMIKEIEQMVLAKTDKVKLKQSQEVNRPNNNKWETV